MQITLLLFGARTKKTGESKLWCDIKFAFCLPFFTFFYSPFLFGCITIVKKNKWSNQEWRKMKEVKSKKVFNEKKLILLILLDLGE